jgi:hypothetical protein
MTMAVKWQARDYTTDSMFVKRLAERLWGASRGKVEAARAALKYYARGGEPTTADVLALVGVMK